MGYVPAGRAKQSARTGLGARRPMHGQDRPTGWAAGRGEYELGNSLCPACGASGKRVFGYLLQPLRGKICAWASPERVHHLTCAAQPDILTGQFNIGGRSVRQTKVVGADHDLEVISGVAT